MSPQRRRLLMAGLAPAAVGLPRAWATNPPDDIVALQVAPWTGHAGEAGWNANVGIQAAFEEANAGGGIRGRRLRLVFEEEAAAEPAEQLRRLQQQWNPVALLGSVGTAPLREVLRQGVLPTLQLPAIGISSGDADLRQPDNPFVLVTRPSTAEELRSVYMHLATINARRSVLVASAGVAAEAVRQAPAVARAAGVEIVASIAYDDTLPAGEAARQALAAAHNAVVIAATTQRTSDFCRAYKAGGRASAQIVSLSTAEPTRLASFSNKAVARGVVFSLAVPNPRNRNVPLVQQFHGAFTRHGPAGVSPTTGMFESYIAARVLIDALQRAPAASAPEVARLLGRSSSVVVAGVPVYFRDKSELNRSPLTILDDEGKMLW